MARGNGGRVTHWRIFRRYWLSITVTLGLIVVAAGLWLFQPYLLGRAIDGLVVQEWIGVVHLAVLQVGVLIIGAAQRYYDTRVYTRIYRDIGAEVVTASQAAGVEITRTAARASMLREVVNFFEDRIPSITGSLIDLVGSLVLLYFLSWRVFLASLAAMGIIAFVSMLYGGRLFALNSGYNDQLEKEIDIYQSKSREATEKHLGALALWQIRRSDTQVSIFSMTNIALMAVVLFALYDTVSVQQAAIGTVFAVLTYVRRFQSAVNDFPVAFQQIIRTLEITRRINRAEERTAEGPQAKPDARSDAIAMRYLGELDMRSSRRGP
jgi:ABC-type multidrug transport system fused ATPase/permease subunit